jgi:hypothetical protein
VTHYAAHTCFKGELLAFFSGPVRVLMFVGRVVADRDSSGIPKFPTDGLPAYLARLLRAPVFFTAEVAECLWAGW